MFANTNVNLSSYYNFLKIEIEIYFLNFNVFALLFFE